MQAFKTEENAPGKQHGEESSRRQWICVFLVILLLHAALIAYLHRPDEPETPAKPQVMDVALLAAPAPQPAKPVPSAPPVVPPKPQPKPVKPKKAPVTPKKTQVAPKPVRAPTPTPEPAPAAKPEAAAPRQTSPAPPVSAPPRPAVTPSAPQPKTETFTEANYKANYKSNPKPEYPRLARSRGWQGKVLLRVQVTADGHAASVQVQQSSGHEILDEAAVEAVKNWTFIPAKRGDTPVASTVTVPMPFKLLNE
ncbi:energy transducer TonB [Methylomicrobium lacus]|uniref:energy transducer TonB n=1 Tax=Methylomicrobium lacus TaxID=136992 RepID=UPI0035A8FAF8